MILLNLENVSSIIRPEYYTNDLIPKEMGWNVPIESLHLVHPHWRQFPAIGFHYHLLAFIFYLILMVFSFVGNGLVIWIFGVAKSLRTPSNLFVINLAVFDFVMMLEMPLFLVNSCYERIVGDELGCNIYAALGSISGIGASITNAMIAFDRYKTISSPLSGRLNNCQAIILIGVTWLWTMPFTVLPFMKIWGTYIPEGFLTTCSFDYLTDSEETKVFVICIFVWAYCIPMVFICTFYGKLFFYVRAHEKMLQDQAKKMNVKSLAANPANQSMEMRIAKIAFTIYFLFVCAWTPYAMVSLISIFGNRNLITPVSSMIPALAAKIVSCIDPWIYAINHPRYRVELAKRVTWLGITEAPLEGDTKSTNSEVTEAKM